MKSHGLFPILLNPSLVSQAVTSWDIPLVVNLTKGSAEVIQIFPSRRNCLLALYKYASRSQRCDFNKRRYYALQNE